MHPSKRQVRSLEVAQKAHEECKDGAHLDWQGEDVQESLSHFD